MSETDILTVIQQLVSSVGMWAVFAYLYIQERNSHDTTRRHWNDDLRDIAGLTKLSRIEPPAQSYKDET